MAKLLIAIAVLVALSATPDAFAQIQGGEHDGAGYASAFNGRKDPIDGSPYLWGNLTWNAGVGGLAWSEDAASEDPGACPGCDEAATRADAMKARVGRTMEEDLGIGADDLRRDLAFTSPPLPQTYYLNPTRFIQVPLFVFHPNGTCTPASLPRISVELHAGDAFVGGSVGTPEAPQAFLAFCLVNLYFAPEQDVLPNGAQLRLVVHHESNALPRLTPFALGMARNHQSGIRIPYFPLEEALFRNPSLSYLLDEDPAPAGPELDLGTPLSLLGMALLTGARWRRIHVLVCLLILLGAFAGCTGKRSPLSPTQDLKVPDRGEVKTKIITDADIDFAQRGFGQLAGTVLDDVDYPVEGVHVSLLGALNFTDTNRYGQFAIYNIPPGDYVVRFQHPEYKSRESDVRIVSGALTRVNIHVQPRVEVELGLRNHRHGEQWAGRETIPLLEDHVVAFPTFDTTIAHSAVKLDAETLACTGGGVQPSGAGIAVPVPTAGEYFCRAPIILPADGSESPLIVPGTADVEITLSWDPAATHGVRLAGVAFIANNDRSLVFAYPKGSEATTHIRTTWEMTDRGHQRATSWGLWVYALAPSGVKLSGVTFEVDMVIHKGLVPMEPAHPDLWGDAQSLDLPLMDRSCLAARKQSGASGTEYADPSVTYECRGIGAWQPKAGVLIPPGTSTIDIALTQVTPHPRGDVPWVLKYRAADAPAGSPDMKTASFAQRAGNVLRYKIDLSEQEADTYYQPASYWVFAAAVTMNRHYLPSDGASAPYLPSAHPQTLQLQLNVTALRGP